MSSKEKRPVTIEERNGAYMVMYVGRKFHGRYSAAQFDMKYSTVDEVREWVGRQPKLVLIEKRS